jgi:hypothetical protein
MNQPRPVADPIVTALRLALAEIAERRRARAPHSLAGAESTAAPASFPPDRPKPRRRPHTGRAVLVADLGSIPAGIGSAQGSKIPRPHA